MKKLKVFAPIVLASLALTGCAPKVSYEKFHEAAMNVESVVYSECKIEIKSSDANGKSTDSYTATYSQNGGVWKSDSIANTLICNVYIAMTAASVGEDEDATYGYSSLFGFEYSLKDDGSSVKVNFNKYGKLVKYTSTVEHETADTVTTVTVKWSK